MPGKLEIILAESAAREIRKMDSLSRRRILEKLSEYGRKPELARADLKRLEDTRDPVQYRLRVGDYRLIIAIEGNTLKILYVLHRSKAY
jgi:mRNA-degrading endonuclease RelE of RelBE toxin-antitoxin system